uniref:Uncharacterized protein n=1 Tax=Siphoviridae sp. ctCeQ13 TaxID=2825380 RepID=A0A8S5PBL0_9CAUD|nr:MAG TPA: hypothetical protein [Siphoviridae sp. ctCeQ13]
MWCPKGVSRKAVDLNKNRFRISTIVDKKTLTPEDNREEASVSSLSFSQ